MWGDAKQDLMGEKKNSNAKLKPEFPILLKFDRF